MQGNFSIRTAVKKDCGIILDFIKGLAKYEKLENAVTATVSDIEVSLFEKNEAEVIIGEENGIPVAFALFFANYSTFLGKSNIYLEDLFVKEEYRGRGYGKKMLKKLAQIAVERQCKRLDWSCLVWNKNSIEFYESIGARKMSEWCLFRLEGEKLAGFVE